MYSLGHWLQTIIECVASWQLPIGPTFSGFDWITPVLEITNVNFFSPALSTKEIQNLTQPGHEQDLKEGSLLRWRDMHDMSLHGEVSSKSINKGGFLSKKVSLVYVNTSFPTLDNLICAQCEVYWNSSVKAGIELETIAFETAFVMNCDLITLCSFLHIPAILSTQ